VAGVKEGGKMQNMNWLNKLQRSAVQEIHVKGVISGSPQNLHPQGFALLYSKLNRWKE
jgi:hypothetical protein